MAPLRLTTRAAGFFAVLQYIPVCVEKRSEEEKEEDLDEEANREGDDEGEKIKNWDIKGTHLSKTF